VFNNKIKAPNTNIKKNIVLTFTDILSLAKNIKHPHTRATIGPFDPEVSIYKKSSSMYPYRKRLREFFFKINSVIRNRKPRYRATHIGFKPAYSPLSSSTPSLRVSPCIDLKKEIGSPYLANKRSTKIIPQKTDALTYSSKLFTMTAPYKKNNTTQVYRINIFLNP